MSTTDNSQTILLTRQYIDENLDKTIRLVDSDENELELFTYNSCSKDSDERLKQCRGVVFNKDKIVLKAYPYHKEINQSDFSELEKDMEGENFEKCTFYDALEGALIRMYYFNDKWYVSTNKKLDAFKSKWASTESFGASFKGALESEFSNNKCFSDFIGEVNIENDDMLTKFKDKLDKNNQYMFFLLYNKENIPYISYTAITFSWLFWEISFVIEK